MSRAKYARSASGSDSRCCTGSSTVLAMRLARRSRSFVNQRSVSLSTRGIAASVNAARTRTSGTMNRSDSFTSNPPEREMTGADRAASSCRGSEARDRDRPHVLGRAEWRQRGTAALDATGVGQRGLLLPVVIGDGGVLHLLDPRDDGAREPIGLDLHARGAVNAT